MSKRCFDTAEENSGRAQLRYTSNEYVDTTRRKVSAKILSLHRCGREVMLAVFRPGLAPPF